MTEGDQRKSLRPTEVPVGWENPRGMMEPDITHITPENHAESCYNGKLYLGGSGPGAWEDCPICAKAKREAQIRARIEACGIGSRYWSTEWDDLVETETTRRFRQAHIEKMITGGYSLMLHGPAGTGKTQTAVLLLKTAIRAGYVARIENLGRLCLDIRESYDAPPSIEAKSVRALIAADLLVLDDLGAGEATSGQLERRVLYLVAEGRHNARRPTIGTTNLHPRELAERVGQRIINRLQPLTVVEVGGKNFRLEQEGGW